MRPNEVETPVAEKPEEKPEEASGPKASVLALNGAETSGAALNGAETSGAALNGAVTSGAELNGAESNGAELNGAVTSGAELNGAVTSGAELNGAESNATESNGAELNGAEVSGAALNGAEASGPEASGAEASGPEASPSIHCSGAVGSPRRTITATLRRRSTCASAAALSVVVGYCESRGGAKARVSEQTVAREVAAAVRPGAAAAQRHGPWDMPPCTRRCCRAASPCASAPRAGWAT